MSSSVSSTDTRTLKRRRDSEESSDSAASFQELKTGENRGEDGFLSFESPATLGGGGKAPIKSEDPPWFDEESPWKSSETPLVALHNEILRFCDLVSPSPAEHSARGSALGDVTRVLKSLWPDCRVKVFGSELTGLALPASDLDVACLGVPPPPPSGRGAGGPGRETSPLRLFADALRTGGLVSQLEVVESAKVPIVKLVHARTGVSADVSFNIEDGLKTGWLMRGHLEANPPLRPLLLVLKYFLMQRGLNETYPSGGVGSFLLQLMALSFLQHRKRRADHMHAATAKQQKDYRQLPPPPSSSSSSAAAAGAPPLPTAPPVGGENFNLGSLLLEFLELFGRKFNYEAVGVSVREGGSYFRKRDRQYAWMGGAARAPNLLCLENPLLPDVDVGRNAFNILTVKRAFMHAHMVLVERLAAQQILHRAHRAERHAVATAAAATAKKAEEEKEKQKSLKPADGEDGDVEKKGGQGEEKAGVENPFSSSSSVAAPTSASSLSAPSPSSAGTASHHTFKHPPYAGEGDASLKDSDSLGILRSSLAAVIFADAILLERNLPTRDNGKTTRSADDDEGGTGGGGSSSSSGGSGGGGKVGAQKRHQGSLFTVTLPPPPQDESEDDVASGDDDDSPSGQDAAAEAKRVGKKQSRKAIKNKAKLLAKKEKLKSAKKSKAGKGSGVESRRVVYEVVDDDDGDGKEAEESPKKKSKSK